MYNSYDILSIKKAKSILCNFKMWQYVSSFIKWNCTKRFLGCGVGLEYYTKIIKLAHAISHPRTHTHNVFLWFFVWEFATRWCFCKPPFYRSRHQGFQLEQLWVKDRKSIKKNSVPCKLKYMYIFSSWQKKSLKSCCKNISLANLHTSIHYQKVLICTCIRTSLLYLCTKHSRHIDVDRCIHSNLVEVKVDYNWHFLDIPQYRHRKTNSKCW